MKSTFRLGIGRSTLFCLIASVSLMMAQESKRFAGKGVTELGGSISYTSTKSVYNSISQGSAFTIFSFAPYIGFFVEDGFELGVNPFGITSISTGNSSITQIMIFAAPSYTYPSDGVAHPFVEVLLGYTSQSNGTTSSGFSWGGRGGVKIEIAERALLNLSVQYLQVTLNTSGATSRSGYDQFLLSAGFTVWL